MVLFSVKDEDELLKVNRYLWDYSIRRTTFFEPDIREYTSIATEPLRGERRLLMKKFRLKK